MTLDHQVDIGADRVSHGGDDIDRLVLIALRLRAPCRAERVELQRPVACGDHIDRGASEGVGCPVDLVPPVGVDRDPVAHEPTEQFVERHAERFALDVPTGDLDRRDRGSMDLAPLRVEIAGEMQHERFGRERVASDDHGFQFVYGRLDRVAEAVEGPLAQAVNAFVGVDAHEQPVLPAVADRVCGDAA